MAAHIEEVQVEDEMLLEEGVVAALNKKRKNVQTVMVDDLRPVLAANKRKKSVKTNGNKQVEASSEEKESKSPKARGREFQCHRCNQWGHKQMECKAQVPVCIYHNYSQCPEDRVRGR